MRTYEGCRHAIGLYKCLLLVSLACQLLLEQVRASPPQEAGEQSEEQRHHRHAGGANDDEETTPDNKSDDASLDQSLAVGSSRAVGGKKAEWSKNRPVPQYLLAMYLLNNTKMDGESRMAGLAFRIDSNHFITSMVKAQKVSDQIDLTTPPSNQEGAFKFSLPPELDLTQVNTEGWQFYPKWMGTLAENIGVYKIETHPKAEDKRRAAELYPNRDRIEMETSTDAPTENCRIHVYSSSEGDNDPTKAKGMLRRFVRLDVTVDVCDHKSLCRLVISIKVGKLCGDVDVGSPVICGGHKGQQRLHYVVSSYDSDCSSEMIALKIAGYSDQIQRALSSNW